MSVIGTTRRYGANPPVPNSRTDFICPNFWQHVGYGQTVRPRTIPMTVVLHKITFFNFISFYIVRILFLCDHKLQTHEISFCFTPNKASQSSSFFILSDLHHKMRYLAPGKRKPFGIMPPSWDSFYTSSVEDDKHDAQGLSPRKHKPLTTRTMKAMSRSCIKLHMARNSRSTSRW
jgi:hypothetical protein